MKENDWVEQGRSRRVPDLDPNTWVQVVYEGGSRVVKRVHEVEWGWHASWDNVVRYRAHKWTDVNGNEYGG